MDSRRAKRPVQERPTYIVSACLAGSSCSYDGSSRPDRRIRELVECGLALAVCPEVMGGCRVPRERCEIASGDGHGVLRGSARVMTVSGIDVSHKLIEGARSALAAAEALKIKKAILKSNSPSCGFGSIYDGSFTGSLKDGDGVAAALLSSRGILIYNEKEWHEKQGPFHKRSRIGRSGVRRR